MSAERTWTHEEPRIGRNTVMPPGPWQGEPDKVQWLDGATGLDCLLVRGPVGSLCGYVGVGPDHPWHGKDCSECLTGCGDDWCYEHSPAALVQVHGGLTFASGCNPSERGEAYGICHTPLPGRPHDVWWFGWDAAHAGDLSLSDIAYGSLVPGEVYRDVAYMQAQCRSLAQQLAAVPDVAP